MMKAALALAAAATPALASSSMSLLLEQQLQVAAAAAEAADALESELKKASIGASLTARPSYPDRWIAVVDCFQLLDGEPTSTVGSGPARIVQERDLQRMAQSTSQIWPFAPKEWVGTPKEWLNNTIFYAGAFMGLEFNGNTVAADGAFGGRYFDLFEWLPLARDGGETTFDGKPVHRWYQSLHLLTTHLDNELLVDESGAPVHMWMNVTTSKTDVKLGYRWLTWEPNAMDQELWDSFNQTLFEHPLVCPEPADPAVKNVTMYVFHPEHNFDIAGQDLGDVTGDTTFVCFDVITNQSTFSDHDYRWLTQWTIEMVPTLGQYLNCNNYPPKCMGKNNWFVGHEAAYYLGPEPAMKRQCGENPLAGEWYSLPIGGQCQDGHVPGDGTCTWRKAERVKTIDGQCLFRGQAFRQSCIAEGRSPFTATQTLYLAAFASSDPSKGGCPPIQVEETSVVVV